MEVEMYSLDEVEQSTLEYFNGNELASNVFITKYALRDGKGNLLEKNPDDMHRRLAKELARIEKKKHGDNAYPVGLIYDALKNFQRIIPQGSPMYGIGNKHKFVSISNCFVVESTIDSYGGIFLTDQHIAQISKRRGGIGFDISDLRPEGLPVNNAAATTTGAISFMHRFSHTGREVGQKGRRGALMISISVHHPDVEQFAGIKNDEESVTGANISIRLTDEFLQAVKDGTEYEQRWPVNDKNVPAVSRMVDARQVWNTIIHSAWFRGEPGLLFWDNILRESPADCYPGFKTISTNPCGEIPLSAYDSCRLLALNAFYYVDDPFTSKAKFNHERFYADAYMAQRLMDDIVDLEIEAVERIIKKIEEDPEDEEIKYIELNLWRKILKAGKLGRRTGTGITALGDTLAAVGIKYGSKRSIEITDEIYRTLKLGCYRASVDMAKELGPFEGWDYNLEKDNPFLLRIKEEDTQLYNDMKKFGRRNIACLTSAPTGSTSMLAGLKVMEHIEFNSTNGIEPVYFLESIRRRKLTEGETQVDFVDKLGDKWQEFTVYHSGLELWKKANPNKDIKKSPYHGATAPEIDWINRVRLQAAAQKHVDHAISSTINLPNNAKEEEVAKIYTAAWEAGLKGITVYRDGCRSGVIIKNEKEIVFPDERPKELPCDVHHLTVKGQEYFVLVGLLEDRPYEVFAGKNGHLSKKTKEGIIVRRKKDFYEARFDDGDPLSPITDTTDEMEECVTRLTSGLLRVGADMHFVVKQLEKVGEKQHELHSFARSVSRALKKYIPDGTEEKGSCPNCESTSLARQEGCVTCYSCGWSKCL